MKEEVPVTKNEAQRRSKRDEALKITNPHQDTDTNQTNTDEVLQTKREDALHHHHLHPPRTPLVKRKITRRERRKSLNIPKRRSNKSLRARDCCRRPGRRGRGRSGRRSARLRRRETGN